MPFRSTWTPVGNRSVRAYVDHPAGVEPSAAAPLVVLVPGLGLPQYLRPTAEQVVTNGLSCAVLDVPGFGSPRGRCCRPDVESIGHTVAEWVRAQRLTGPCVLLGHSTGSQAALVAALELQGATPLALIMAGPTFAPRHRRLPRLAAAAAVAYRQDSPRVLVVVPTVLRDLVGVWSLLRSGMRDVPERRIRDLRVPLALTAGTADTLVPAEWLSRLAASVGPATTTTVRVLPGSHDNPFSHAEELAGLVTEVAGLLGGPHALA